MTAVVLPGLMAFALLTAVAHDQSVALPGLLGPGTSLLFLMNVVPLVITGTLTHSLAQRLPEAEDMGARSVHRYDTVLVLLTVAASTATAWSVGHLSHSAAATEAGRNTLFLVGLALLGGAVRPQLATVAPVTWVFVTAFAGYRDFRRPWPWAVTLHPAGYPPTFLLCLAVLAGGLAALTRTRRPL
ncbi:hypothetical protein [Streptomyces omiyaensis]|uniref:Uncharacterized protein n=1 Tax=Streptomyces omiyaensis TaxID=68247 RepID=A0ABW7BZU1_9ACTN|nr:hypothetical protein [Streptomyces omiyaensis]GGY24149.1 hypothetical protein GCM10010363_00310 [Streptomyces omiyaensis]